MESNDWKAGMLAAWKDGELEFYYCGIWQPHPANGSAYEPDLICPQAHYRRRPAPEAHCNWQTEMGMLVHNDAPYVFKFSIGDGRCAGDRSGPIAAFAAGQELMRLFSGSGCEPIAPFRWATWDELAPLGENRIKAAHPSVVPTEQRVFEDWLAKTKPPGDCEAVQALWEASDERADWIDEVQPNFTKQRPRQRCLEVEWEMANGSTVTFSASPQLTAEGLLREYGADRFARAAKHNRGRLGEPYTQAQLLATQSELWQAANLEMQRHVRADWRDQQGVMGVKRER